MRLLEATIVLIAHRLWTIDQVMVVSVRLLEATIEPDSNDGGPFHDPLNTTTKPRLISSQRK